MKRKTLFIILALCLVLAVGILAACNENDDSGQQTPGGENPGTGETVRFTVTFDTQGGSTLADITVENGQAIGEFSLPTKQCSRLVGFALDTAGEQMWNVLTDTVSANITLYAIWEDAHTWSEWTDTTPATCTENGERTRECEVCDKTESEAIDALGHDYAEEYTVDVIPTCEGVGSESRHCTRCDATTDSRNINALGHTWGDWTDTTPATCTENGERTRECEVCDKTESEAIDALGHDYAEEYTVDVIPTCEGVGSESRHCTRCDATTDSRNINALGHTWGDWTETRAPGCETEGEKERSCAVCGKTESEAIDALGHDADGAAWEHDPESHWKICKRCNKEAEKNAHDFGTTGICFCGVIGETPVSEFIFSSLGNNEWEVTEYIGTRLAVVIPSVYQNGAVTSIGNYAFYYCINLTSITIPNSVTSIGDYAFADCRGLTSITISDSVTSIGSSAFYGCDGLTSITIPDSVTSIGSSAFFACDGLTSITIPDSVTSIGDDAFYSCDGLTSVTIGNGVTSIGDSAFAVCSGLTSVYISDIAAWCGISFGDGDANPLFYKHNLYLNGELVTDLAIPDSVTSIGHYTFYGSALTSVTIPDSVTSIGDYAFADCRGLTSITIPDSVTSIGSSAFYGCDGLTSITIPDSVESIGDDAFYDCNGLTSITIPDSVTSIGSSAFSGCTGLTEINWNAVSVADLNSGSNVFFDAGTAGDGIAVTFGESVEKIPAYLFTIFASSSYCPNIKSVIIGSNVTSIGSSAFEDCTGLTSITIPDSVTSIGARAFLGCSGLTEINWNAVSVADFDINSNVFPNEWSASACITVTFGESVQKIPAYAFYDCTSLTSVTIGSGMTSIGDSAFSRCYKLVEVYNKSSLSITAGSSSYGNIGSYAKNVYTAEGGSWFTDTLDGYCFLYDGTDGYLIGYYGDQTELALPDSFTAYDGTEITEYSIYRYAFAYQDGITSVTIPDSVTSIGDSAFYYCTGLTFVTIGNGVASIGNSAFEDCTGLTSATIGNGVTSIGWGAFEDCSRLASVTIGGGVTSIGNYAFAYCSDLTSLTIPDSVTGIGHSAFLGCTNLIQEENGVSYVDKWVIDSDAPAGEVILRSDTVGIGDYAFSGCSSLTSITIPDSVTSIGWNVFRDCTGLTEINWNAASVADFNPNSAVFYNAGTAGDGIAVTFGESVEKIPARLFYVNSSSYRPNIKSVIIGPKVTSIGDGAFSNCNSLTSVIIGNGVTSIGYDAFKNCNSLTSITIPDSVTSIGSSAFWYCSGLTSIHYTGDVAGWCGISGLDEVMSSERTLYIDGKRVEGAVVIPDGVQSVPSYAFCYQTDITSITIPNSVTSIGDGAFRGCSGLTSVTIGNGVTSIGSSAFEGCSDLASVYYTGDVAGWCGISRLNYVMSSWRTLYINGNKVAGAVVIPDGVQSVPSYAFCYQTDITSITIPDSVTSIGELAFEYCSGLTSVTIGNSVTSIGSYAFYGCSGLSSITIPDSVTNIGGNAFSGTAWYDSQPDGLVYAGKVAYKYKGTMPNNTSIVLREGTLGIADYAFSDCSGLTSITIPDSVTSIGDYAFYNCSGLTSITIPDSVTSIGSSAFYGCSGLTSIHYTGDVAGWCGISGLDGVMSSGRTLYIDGKKVEGAIVIPDGVQSVPSYAFYYQTGITSITIPDSVTSIGDRVFYGCSGLTSVTFEGTVDEWNVIDKVWNWNSNCPFTEVVCSDGTVSV